MNLRMNDFFVYRGLFVPTEEVVQSLRIANRVQNCKKILNETNIYATMCLFYANKS